MRVNEKQSSKTYFFGRAKKQVRIENIVLDLLKIR